LNTVVLIWFFYIYPPERIPHPITAKPSISRPGTTSISAAGAASLTRPGDEMRRRKARRKTKTKPRFGSWWEKFVGL